MRIELLDREMEEKYEAFLLEDESTLLYASNKYRRFLREFLGIEDNYLIAIDVNGSMLGAFPAFFKRNATYGNVLNSLPFYGSNGAIVEYQGNREVRRQLLSAFNTLAEEQKCVATTIITSPFEQDIGFYEKEVNCTCHDMRIGQLTKLPSKEHRASASLLDRYDGAGRRNIRKAVAHGVTVECKESSEVMGFLADTHRRNIMALKGIPKSRDFFASIPLYFDYGKDYKLFTAYKKGTPVASLLLFYFNATVEYFTPAVSEDYRTYQPLALLIYEAMKDAVAREFKWWNWGGTWKSQVGVYRFKKKWGAVDMPYHYYTRLYDESILQLDKQLLCSEYKNFYVVPFERLAAP